MHTKTKLWLLGLFSAAPIAALAGDLVVPNSFTPGTPISSAQMNANFSAAAAAVNSKQDRVTGTCGPGLAITGVNADGTVSCGGGAPGGLAYGAELEGSSPGPGLGVFNDGGSGAAIEGVINGTNYYQAAVLGRASNPLGAYYGAGVEGINESQTGYGIGVAGYQYGSGWGVYGYTSGPGYGVYGESWGLDGGAGVVGQAGVGDGVVGHSSAGRGVVGYHGSAQSAEPAVLGESSSQSGYATGVLGRLTSVQGGYYAAAVQGSNLSQNEYGIGVAGYQSGTGWGVYGSAGGVGVFGESYGTGVGVRANGPVQGAALSISGPIRVEGAGTSTNAPVFAHVTSASNTTGASSYLDHPLLNGAPGVFLFVTQNLTPPSGAAVIDPHPTGTFYDPGTQRWAILNVDGASMPAGAAFNVMVIKP